MIDELFYPNIIVFSILLLPFFTIENGSIFLKYLVKIQNIAPREQIYSHIIDLKHKHYFFDEFNYINKSYGLKDKNIFQNKLFNSTIKNNVDVLKFDIFFYHNKDLSIYYEYHVLFSGRREDIDSVILEIKSIQPKPTVKNVQYETIFPVDSTSDFLVHSKLVIFI